MYINYTVSIYIDIYIVHATYTTEEGYFPYDRELNHANARLRGRLSDTRLGKPVPSH
jgi:hypothetical protein